MCRRESPGSLAPARHTRKKGFTLNATEGSSATLRLRTTGGVIVEHVALAEFEPVPFEESVPLGMEEHELIVSLRGRPRSAGPGGQCDGAVGVSLSAWLAPSVGTDASGWGRIKNLYR